MLPRSLPLHVAYPVCYMHKRRSLCIQKLTTFVSVYFCRSVHTSGVEEATICPIIHFQTSLLSSKASISVALSIMLKRVGAETHPCFNPFETEITSDISLLCTIPTFIPSWSWRITEMNLSRHLNVFMIAHRPTRQTVSKAFDKSTKINNRLLFCFWYFSCTCLAAKLMSTTSANSTLAF